MITFTLFDLRNTLSVAPARLMLPLALVLVIGLTAPVQGAAVVCGGYVGTMLLSYIFLGDERGRLDALYALSRVSRTSVVVGRYLTGLALVLVASGFGLAVSLVAILIRHQSVNWTMIGMMAVAAFGVAAISAAVQLPWFFAKGYTRGRQVMYALILVFVVLGWVASRTHLFDSIQVPTQPGRALETIAVVTVAGGVAIVAASALLASRLYAKREL